MNKLILTTFGFIVALLMQGCMADIRTKLVKKEGITQTNEEKGKSLLKKAWKKHGYANLHNHQTYSFEGADIWKGMMGRMGKPWPEAKSTIAFKYAVGTFDSQAHFKDGKREGVIAGLQSWNYYEKEVGKGIEFKEMNKRIRFGLSAYHYFFEMLDRLERAPIISYAGEKKFNDTNYDLIFATWDKPEPHMKNDQYMLWINRNTGMLEYAEYTLRESYLKIPGYKAFYGSIKYDDFRNVDGVMIPHQQTVFLNSPSKKDKKHLHRLNVKNFEFDSFDLKELYPNPEIQKIGDSKSF